MIETGLIIDMQKHTVTVLTRDNGYYKILRKPAMYISQEIQFKITDIINVVYFARRLPIVAAAAILVVFAVFFYANLNNDKSTENLAYISLDTNLSVQFTINGDDRVVDVEFKGGDTKEPLGKWEPQGMKIEDAFNDTIKRSQEKGIIETNEKTSFLISGTFNSDAKMGNDELKKSDERITALLNKLKSNIDSMSKGENETLIIKCNPNYKKEADKNNISIGRYALFSELNKNGSGISLDVAKENTVSDLIKEYRQINQSAFLSNTPLPYNTSSKVPLFTPYSTSIASIIDITDKPLPFYTPIITPGNSNILFSKTPMPSVMPYNPFVTNTPLPLVSWYKPFISNTPLPLVSPNNPLVTDTPVHVANPYPTSITKSSITVPNSDSVAPQEGRKNNTITPDIVNSATPTPTPTPTNTPVPTVTPTPTGPARFEAYNLTGYYIRHSNFVGRVDPSVSPIADSQFIIIPGLADPTCFTLESVNFPGYYLRHRKFQIYLDPSEGTDLFKKDATFRIVPGFSDSSCISFQSYNYPYLYIRHRSDQQLWIDPITDNSDKSDATFIRR